MKKPNKPTLCAAIALAMAGNAVFASEPSDSTTAANDTTGVISLNEVEVVAERVIHKGDHEVLLLSEENRTFGTNALDAISSLVYFNTSLNGRTLTNDLNQNVYILINGVPADGDRLRTYKGDDIKKVEYYAIAPPKYTIFTFGPIVNVITKKETQSAIRWILQYVQCRSHRVWFQSGRPHIYRLPEHGESRILG